MKLIDILVEELPKRGGWPDGADHAWCDPDGEIRFRNGGCEPDFYPESDVDIECRVPNPYYEDESRYIITRDQYEAALAAKNDGWIDWGGGVIPISTNTFVDVKFNNGDVRLGKIAGEYSWEHVWEDSNIIAYRLHQPQEATEADDEADLNDCIGQGVAQVWSGEEKPTIGTKCEHHSGGQWEVVTIAGIYENLVTGFTDYWMVKEDGCSYTVGNPYRFRPIRSEADKKRDEAVEDIDYWLPESVSDTPNEFYHAKKIYDAIAAGKVRGVKLED